MAALMRWHRLPEFEAEFIAEIPKFGASSELTEWAQNYTRFHGGRCYWDAQFVGKYSPRRCLNIGGAPYIFEYALKKIFPQIESMTIDLEPDRFPEAASTIGTRVVRGDIEREYPDIGQFDVVVFAEIFEHLRFDLLGTMKRVRELMSIDGRLYLTMPNGLGFNALRKHLMRGRTGPPPVEEWVKLTNFGHMGHVREYSLTEVQEVLLYCGFNVEKACYRTQHINWPARDLLLRWRPALGDDVLVVASKAQPTFPSVNRIPRVLSPSVFSNVPRAAGGNSQ